MKTEKQLTTVEWFGKKVLDVITTSEFNELLEQAKQMENQRLKDAYAMGREGKTIGEFNETFKSE